MREISPIRILLMADSHLGFDLPVQPRVERRRRGHDFLANHERALRPALEGRVDLVVHGGDLFHRSRVPPSLVYQAFQPLLEVAKCGIPVYLVPGNHERSRIPHQRFATHPNIHIFREPTTFHLRIRNTRIALSGFPYHRKGIRGAFPEVLKATGWHLKGADLRLLCIHHCVEGATVGPSNFTFRHNPDVIRALDLPGEFAAVLSGHIHRHQILREDLRGRPLRTPVYYPGSVERTAFAEAGERKGYLLLEAAPSAGGGQILANRFVELPARPMAVVHLSPPGEPEGSWAPGQLKHLVQEALDAHPPDAVLQIRVRGPVPPHLREEVAARTLRRTAPEEMNLQVLLADPRSVGRHHRSGRGPVRPRVHSGQHPLAI